MPKRARRILLRAAAFITLGLATTCAITVAAASTPRKGSTLNVAQFPVQTPRGQDTLDLRELATWNSTLRGWYIQRQLEGAWETSASLRGLESILDEDRTDKGKMDVLFDPVSGGFGKIARGTARPPAWGLASAARESPDRARPAGIEYAAGWPFHAFWCELDNPDLGPFLCMLPVARAKGGILIPRRGDSYVGSYPATSRILPLRPLWLGLAANTLLFSAAWYCVSLLVVVPLRRFRASRRVHHLCTRCRYDLTGLDPATPCPECGAPRRS